MKPKHGVAILLTGTVGLCIVGSSSVTASELPTADTLDCKTLGAIQRCLTKFHVAQVPRNYEVSMVTGGLNTPSVDIMRCDNKGNMILAPVSQHEPLYIFQQTAPTPATWMVRGGMVCQGPTTQSGFKPVPWVRKETGTGQTYYAWDRNSYMVSYYFKKEDTFVVLDISSGVNRHYPFPEGVMTHLAPVGNPVE